MAKGAIDLVLNQDKVGLDGRDYKFIQNFLVLQKYSEEILILNISVLCVS